MRVDPTPHDSLRWSLQTDQGAFLPTLVTSTGTDVDFIGWDVRRFLSLLRNSNADALDALRSHLRHVEIPQFTSQAEHLARRGFSARVTHSPPLSGGPTRPTLVPCSQT
eukprot:Sspe_Gene.87524::Locus_58952_Transcript_3_7_Confidence_0.684_Length_580::g.87524::m.87524